MNKFREDLKVNIEPEKINKNIELIQQYINKEKEINRRYDEEDGIDVDSPDYSPDAEVTLMRIKSLLSYREIRVKQAYISKILREDNSRGKREWLASIDKDRRDKHNHALISFRALIEFAKANGIEAIYTGPLLTEKEIEEHKSVSYDARMEMTDAFLKLLIDLEEYPTRTCEDKDMKRDLEKIQNDIYKVKREYKIKQELQNDDGDIIFEDEKELTI